MVPLEDLTEVFDVFLPFWPSLLTAGRCVTSLSRKGPMGKGDEPSRVLFLTSIPADANVASLSNLFRTFRGFERVDAIKDKTNRWVGFVHFASVDDADGARPSPPQARRGHAAEGLGLGGVRVPYPRPRPRHGGGSRRPGRSLEPRLLVCN